MGNASSESGDFDDRILAIADEFLARCRAGESPTLEEYIARHPELEQDIRRVFPTVAAVEGMAIARHEVEGSSALGPTARFRAEGIPLPDRLGDYEIRGELGRGGMGVVYEARQVSLDRRVALKVLPPSASLDASFLERFQLEAHSAARLQYPGIVPVYGTGEENGLHYYAMQLIDGHGLDQVVAALNSEAVDDKSAPSLGTLVEKLRGTSELTTPSTSTSDSSSSHVVATARYQPFYRNVAQLGLRLARAVAHAHGQGILHRDIKPSNVLVDAEGRAFITDFGLCRIEGSDRLTQTGAMVGTLRYMAPEAFAGVTDVRSDVYGLGITLYELVVGQSAFPSANRGTTIRKVTEGDFPRARTVRREIPPDLDTIIAKATATEPKDRYATADALSQDLRAFLEGRPIAARASGVGYLVKLAVRRHRAAFWTGTAAAVVLATMAGVFVMELQHRYTTERGLRGDLEVHMGEILRLSDLKRLRDARARAAELWPAVPAIADDLGAWLHDHGRPLRSRLDEHRALLAKLEAAALPYDDAQRAEDRRTHPDLRQLTELESQVAKLEVELEDPGIDDARRAAVRGAIADFGSQVAALREKVETRRTWKYPDTEDQWWHDTLRDLVSELETFLDPDPFVGTFASIEARLAVAKRLEEETVSGEAVRASWARARDAIRALDGYGGFDLAPQVGLVPLGPDPRSGLWEFWHVASGARPEPNPDPEAFDRWLVDGETGVILVLVPGGSGILGAQSPRLGVRLEAVEGGLRVSTLFYGLAHDLGIQEGDVIRSVNGQTIMRAEDVSAAIGRPLGGTPIELVLLRAGEPVTLSGTFPPGTDPDAQPNENPVEVTFEPFFIGRHEITQGQWLRATGRNPAQYPPSWNFSGNQNTLANPIETINWAETDRFLTRLDLRLPIEDEWEWMARAGTKTPWWCGAVEQTIEEQRTGNLADAWTRENRGPSNWAYEDWLRDGWAVHAPVGNFRPNPWGIHDTIGNVSEWTATRFGQTRAEEFRVVRGGAFSDRAETARSSARGGTSPRSTYEFVGVRAARSVR